MSKYLLILILGIMLAASVASAAEPAGAPAQQKVAGVELAYPGELPSDVRGLIPINKGDSYSPRKVRESIRLLYLKGMFEDIVVEGTDTPGGLLLKYTLVPRLRITKIRVDGEDYLSKKKILEKVLLKEGDFVDTGLIEKSRLAVVKLSEEEGFRKARAELAVSKLDELTAVLEVNLTEGPPTRVKEMKLTGELTLPEKDVRDELELTPGDILSKEGMDKTVSALTTLYTDGGYVKADIQPAVTYLDDSATVEIKVQAGPKLEVTFEGNDDVSDRKLKKVLTFWEDRDISDESVQENLDKLIAFYKKQGYYFAAVTSRTEETITPPTVSVKFIVYEGPRSKLTRIAIDGNKDIKADDILAAMELKTSSFFRSRRVTDEEVAADVERIKGLYDSKGYLKAEVTAEPLAFDKDRTEAALKIEVKEGPRTYVTSIDVQGNKGVKTKRIMKAIKQEVGKPYIPQQEKDDQNSILNLYSQRGYINATVDAEKKFSEDNKGLALTYKVSEGFPVKIGRIILRGNVVTRDKVVTRELLIKPGDTFDLENILKSQQKIYKLGFFSQVRLQPVEPEKPEPVKDVLVNLKERPGGAVEFGVGYGDFDKFRGFAEVSYRNLYGLGHRVSLRGEASTKEYKAVLAYRWPWFLDYKLDASASLLYQDAQKVNYHIKDAVAAVGFAKAFKENITGSLVYQYERLDLSNVNKGAALAPEDKNRSNLSSVTPSVSLDFRDNPFNPTKGSVHGVQVKWATPTFGSGKSFIKNTAQTSWFFSGDESSRAL